LGERADWNAVDSALTHVPLPLIGYRAAVVQVRRVIPVIQGASLRQATGPGYGLPLKHWFKHSLPWDPGLRERERSELNFATCRWLLSLTRTVSKITDTKQKLLKCVKG